MNKTNTFFIIITTILTTICIQIIFYNWTHTSSFAGYKKEVLQKLTQEQQYTIDTTQQEKLSQAIQLLSSIENEQQFVQTLEIENKKLSKTYINIDNDEIRKNISNTIMEDIASMYNQRAKKEAEKKLVALNHTNSFREYQEKISELYFFINEDFEHFHKDDGYEELHMFDEYDEADPELQKVRLRNTKAYTIEELTDLYEYSDDVYLKTRIEKILTAETEEEVDQIRMSISDFEDSKEYSVLKYKKVLPKKYGDILTDKEIKELRGIENPDVFYETLDEYVFRGSKESYIGNVKNKIESLSNEELKLSLGEKLQKLEKINDKDIFGKKYNDLLLQIDKILYPELKIE